MTMRWLFAGLVGFAVAAMSVNMAARGQESATQARGQSGTNRSLHNFDISVVATNGVVTLALP